MDLWIRAARLFEPPAIGWATGIGIKASPLHGHGVFALRRFSPGDTIELSPVILLPHAHRELLQHTILFGYYFVVDDRHYGAAVGLGAASLYNHSYTANARYTISVKSRAITVKACKTIQEAEEITLNYNGDPDDASPVYLPSESAGFVLPEDEPALPSDPSGQLPLYLKTIPGKGRGVFCKDRIEKDTLIETGILLVLPERDHSSTTSTYLKDYIFSFDKDNGETALALGFGSLYNHALYPNATFAIDQTNRRIFYYALEDIPAGIEICINYDGQPGSEKWFESRNM